MNPEPHTPWAPSSQSSPSSLSSPSPSYSSCRPAFLPAQHWPSAAWPRLAPAAEPVEDRRPSRFRVLALGYI